MLWLLEVRARPFSAEVTEAERDYGRLEKQHLSQAGVAPEPASSPSASPPAPAVRAVTRPQVAVASGVRARTALDAFALWLSLAATQESLLLWPCLPCDLQVGRPWGRKVPGRNAARNRNRGVRQLPTRPPSRSGRGPPLFRFLSPSLPSRPLPALPSSVLSTCSWASAWSHGQGVFRGAHVFLA